MLPRAKDAAVGILAVVVCVMLPAAALANTGPYEPNDSAVSAYGPLHPSTDYFAALETIVDEDWHVFYSSGMQQVILTFSDAPAVNGFRQAIEVVGPTGQLFGASVEGDEPLTR